MNDLDQRLMLLGRLLGTVRGLPTAAMYLARHGVPVFPCASGFKRPIVKGGFTAATVDVRQVETWWLRWPDANLAVPTGAASGLDVVDVDRHSDSDTGLLSFGRARDAGLLSGWSSLVETPSGGLHIYFPADPNRPQRIWQAASAQVDFRGDGGYVLVPPSRVRQKDGTLGAYVLRSTSPAPTAPVDAQRLLELLAPPKPARARPVPSTPREARNSDAGRARWVAAQPEGNRNWALYFMSCRMTEDGIAKADIVRVLLPAAEQAGLGEREILRTIDSAWERAHPTTGQQQSPQSARSAMPGSPRAGHSYGDAGWVRS